MTPISAYIELFIIGEKSGGKCPGGNVRIPSETLRISGSLADVDVFQVGLSVKSKGNFWRRTNGRSCKVHNYQL